jgi:hypothetical protein
MFSAIGSTAWSSFTVNNTTIAATDTVILSYSGGLNSYLFTTGRIIAGTSFVINFVSLAGVVQDAPVINFTIIKSVAS